MNLDEGFNLLYSGADRISVFAQCTSGWDTP